MNRNEEYWALVAELGETPPALDGTVERARVRARKARAGRWLGIPAASLAGAVSAFILLVDCSMPFAMACRRVPFVRALAEAVARKRGLRRMSAQAVGGAVGHNPISIIVPCHRVVGSDGSLTGYAGGLERKVQLLRLEGVDMSRLYVPKKGTAL